MPRAQAGELGIFPSQTNLIISAKHLVPCQVTQTQVLWGDQDMPLFGEGLS